MCLLLVSCCLLSLSSLSFVGGLPVLSFAFAVSVPLVCSPLAFFCPAILLSVRFSPSFLGAVGCWVWFCALACLYVPYLRCSASARRVWVVTSVGVLAVAVVFWHRPVWSCLALVLILHLLSRVRLVSCAFVCIRYAHLFSASRGCFWFRSLCRSALWVCWYPAFGGSLFFRCSPLFPRGRGRCLVGVAHVFACILWTGVVFRGFFLAAPSPPAVLAWPCPCPCSASFFGRA